MDIFIETLTGTAFELRVSQSDTILSIKNKIQRHEGIPVSQQHLLWHGKELLDTQMLSDYEILPGCTLKLVLKMRGGPMNTYRPSPSFKFSSFHVLHPMYSKTFLDPLKRSSKSSEFSDNGSGSSTEEASPAGSSDDEEKNASYNNKDTSLSKMAKDLIKLAKAAEKKITLLILDYEDHIKLLSFPNESGTIPEGGSSEPKEGETERDSDQEKVKLPVLKESPDETCEEAIEDLNLCNDKPNENVPTASAVKENSDPKDNPAMSAVFASLLESANTNKRIPNIYKPSRASILNKKLPPVFRWWESDKVNSSQKSDDSDGDQNCKLNHPTSKLDLIQNDDFGLSPPEEPDNNNEDDSNDEDLFFPGWEGLWLGYRDERGSLGSSYNAYSSMKGGPISATRSSVNLGRIPSTSWSVECDQMAAKVADLKAKMADKRLRKQKKVKGTESTRFKDTESDDIVCTRKFRHNDASCLKSEKTQENPVSDAASVDAVTCDFDLDRKDLNDSIYGLKSRGESDSMRLGDLRYSDELFSIRQSISNRFKPRSLNSKYPSSTKNIGLNTLHSHNFPVIMSPQSSKRKITPTLQDRGSIPVPMFKSEDNLPSIPSASVNRIMTPGKKQSDQGMTGDKNIVPSLDQSERPSDSQRCKICKKRTGLANSYSCRCGQNFCARHRYAESHSCQYDYKTEAREVLRETNPVVAAAKLPKI